MQLRKKSRFFDKPARGTPRRLKRDADHMRNDWDKEISPFLADDEFAQVSALRNPATHILTQQDQHLAGLHRQGRLDLFHQIDLMAVVRELYALQGKRERIKNTPFPRQYAEYSRAFTRVFIFLIPFGLLDVFGDQVGAAATAGENLALIAPMILVSWVFTTIEAIGDASEDPFERSLNDVPMNALTRTIELDLRQMLGETELPEPEKASGMVMH